MSVNRSFVVVVVGIVALLASAGAALAASAGQDEPAGRCDARLAKAAERRGISAEQLEARIEARRLARVDAALRAGRISPERADALRARISARELCPRAPLVRIALAHRPLLRAAAGYLDLRPGELRAQLPGTSLAALAQARGKSVEGLEAAMLAPAQAGLARAVATGRLAQARADRMLPRLERRIDRLVQRIFPAR